MAKTTSPAVASILKDIRTSLEERVDEKSKAAPGPKGPLRVIGVRASGVKSGMARSDVVVDKLAFRLLQP